MLFELFTYYIVTVLLAAGPIPPRHQEAVPLAAVVPAPPGLAVQARVIPPVARVGAEATVVLGTGRSQKGKSTFLYQSSR